MTSFLAPQLPAALTEALAEHYTPQDLARLAAGYGSTRRSALRVNRSRVSREEAAAALSAAGIACEPISWYADGLLLDANCESALRETELYQNGDIYLQNPSSMLPPLLLGAKEKEDILDMCAAPGSKTTQLHSLCPTAHITACEKDKVRAERLRYNLQKQGAKTVNVMVADARKLDSYLRFDRILLDAPCSGSGTLLAARPASYKAYSAALVNNSAALQSQLLKKAVSLLKKGGEMVYSTCSVHRAENEAVVLPLLKQGLVEVVPAPAELAAALPLLPGDIEGALLVCPTDVHEGFFAVKLRKVK